MSLLKIESKKTSGLAYGLITIPAVAGIACLFVTLNNWVAVPPVDWAWKWSVFYFPPLELLCGALGLIYFRRTSQSLLMGRVGFSWWRVC
jgi:hypothetical protein